MNGSISYHQEFLFPDSPLGEMPRKLRTVSAKNEKIGLQLMFECPGERGCITLDAPQFDVEYYRMLPIPVEYNTGNGVDQGGAMVISVDHCPDYAIRQAPFLVYDCLKPMESGAVESENGRVSAYVTLVPKADTPAGEYALTLTLEAGKESHTCAITHVVYPVSFNEDRFQQTNWFSVAAMEQMHHVKRGTPEFYDVVRAYARSMRSVHQKVFLLWLHEDLSLRRPGKPYHFDFEDMKPILEIFFEEGFETFETGGILCRGYKPDGSPDMFSADLKCNADPTVSVDSEEGYELLCCEMRDLSDFLRRNGWEDRVLFHIMDEPDVHIHCDADLQARRVQFFMAANIVRRYLPNVRILEAVKSTRFRGGVDILCPITDGYEREKEAFDKAMALGDEVWTYVCCGPEGKWLNRFLDSPVINGRLLFWGCAKYGIRGYLHWGYNQFGGVPNPFEKTAAKNWTGIGTDFPCGDAFIVYPGEKGPWPSLRLEAERRGAEEAALLSVLKEQDREAHDALIDRVFRTFREYNNDPELLERTHEELLQALSKA